MKNNKVVLAFSGGLDTTYCAIYLNKVKNMEVHAVLVNTGGFDTEELKRIENHAFKLGVKSFKCIDDIDNFYKTVVKYLIFGNILKNNTKSNILNECRFIVILIIFVGVLLIILSHYRESKSYSSVL